MLPFFVGNRLFLCSSSHLHCCNVCADTPAPGVTAMGTTCLRVDFLWTTVHFHGFCPQGFALAPCAKALTVAMQPKKAKTHVLKGQPAIYSIAKGCLKKKLCQFRHMGCPRHAEIAPFLCSFALSLPLLPVLQVFCCLSSMYSLFR